MYLDSRARYRDYFAGLAAEAEARKSAPPIDLSMVRHYARREKLTASALAIAGEHIDARKNKRSAVSDIRQANRRRGGAITYAAAGERLAAALPVASRLVSFREIGMIRRKKAAVEGHKTEKQRLDAAVQRLIGRPCAGQAFSGSTGWNVEYGEPAASTSTWEGDQYSSRCKWKKTCASHQYRATLSGLLRVRRAGLPIRCRLDRAMIIDAQLVRTEPGGRVFSAKCIVERNKGISLRDVFIADQGGGKIYFGRTVRGCVTAIRRASATPSKDDGLVTQSKLSRRYGWCHDGIRSWCLEHGIRRNLAERLRKGTSREALRRLFRKQGFRAKTAYDETLLRYTG